MLYLMVVPHIFLNVKYKEYISKNLAHILNNFFIYIFILF